MTSTSFDKMSPAFEVMSYVAAETHGHYSVGIDPEQFFHRFLPWNSATAQEYKDRAPGQDRVSCLKVVSEVVEEKSIASMSSKYVKSLDKWVVSNDNKMLRFATFEDPDVECDNLNIDVSTYWEDSMPLRNMFAAQQTQEIFRPTYRDDAFWSKLDEPLDESDTEFESLPASNTSEENSDADSDHDDEPLPCSETGENRSRRGCTTLSEIATFAGIALSMAFRSHIFSVLLVGRCARFIRWDRRGAVVTRRFDYVRRPNLIFNFYLRYGQLSEHQRGLDNTITRWTGTLPVPVKKAFNNYSREAWYGGAKFQVPSDSYEQSTLIHEDIFFRVEVMDHFLKRTEAFIIPAPRYHPRQSNPFSRGTRRSLACPLPNVNNEPLGMCFIKESWQDRAMRCAPEADIYRTLNGRNVPHVASMRLGGDVEGLVTETQEYYDESSRASELGAMVCHRIVLDTIARDLSTFGWTKVLLSCVADAVQAAQQAYKHGVLHRDISSGNIMITRDRTTGEWRGLLVDWDMCNVMDKADQKNEFMGRTGTWAFMSINVLTKNSPVPHRLSDDLESFLWVIIFQALRYLHHDLVKYPAALTARFNKIFSMSSDSAGTKDDKIYACAGRRSSSSLARFDSEGLNDVIDTLGHVIYYSRYDDDKKLSDIDLDDPDNGWMENLLRQNALTMEPLNITPTGLKSPEKNSRPPADASWWQAANSNDAPFDFHNNRIGAAMSTTTTCKTGCLSLNTSQINHIDGISADIPSVSCPIIPAPQTKNDPGGSESSARSISEKCCSGASHQLCSPQSKELSTTNIPPLTSPSAVRASSASPTPIPINETETTYSRSRNRHHATPTRQKNHSRRTSHALERSPPSVASSPPISPKRCFEDR